MIGDGLVENGFGSLTPGLFMINTGGVLISQKQLISDTGRVGFFFGVIIIGGGVKLSAIWVYSH